MVTAKHAINIHTYLKIKLNVWSLCAVVPEKLLLKKEDVRIVVIMNFPLKIVEAVESLHVKVAIR